MEYLGDYWGNRYDEMVIMIASWRNFQLNGQQQFIDFNKVEDRSVVNIHVDGVLSGEEKDKICKSIVDRIQRSLD